MNRRTEIYEAKCENEDPHRGGLCHPHPCPHRRLLYEPQRRWRSPQRLRLCQKDHGLCHEESGEDDKANSKKSDTATTTLKKSQKKVTIPGTYVGILNDYKEALTKKWGNQACLQNGVSNVLPELYEGIPLENVGFWVGDYNGDGTTDLIIGVVDGYSHYPYAILDYYTMDNNKQAYNVFQSQPKDYFSAISGKRIMEKISDNKEFTAWYLYGLNSNGMALTFKEGLLRDQYANKKNPWYKADDMDGNTKNDTKVSNDAGKKRQKQFDNARVQLEFIQFSKFNPVAKK